MILKHVTVVLLVVATTHSILVVLMLMMEGRRGWGCKDVVVAVVHVVHGDVHVIALEGRGEVLHQLRLGVAFGISGKSNKK